MDIIAAIGSVGFPVVACIYLIYRIDKQIVSLTGAITQLTDELRQHRAVSERIKR